jgi:hypothetical protein
MYLRQNLDCSLMKLGSIWVRLSKFRTVGTGALLIWERLLKNLFAIRIFFYDVLLLFHK